MGARCAPEIIGEIVMKFTARIIGSAIAYVLGVSLTGILTPLLHLPTFKVPAAMQNSDPQRMLLVFLLCAVAFMLALTPLAAGLRGGWTARWFAVGSLLYIALGLNTMLELKIFSNMLPGSALGASLQMVLPSFLAAAVLTLPLKRRDEPSTIGHFSGISWSWRLVLAWLSFPLFYLIFGMCVAPFVIGHYQTGELGLMIPPPTVMLRMQLLRSVFFLAASFPAIVLWRKSRIQFIVAMGLAHAFAVGIFQLALGSFLPTILRIAHSIEITFDSFAYAAVLGLLFIVSTRKAEARSQQTAAPHGNVVTTHS
jgi:hypothetical protein